MQTDLDVQHVKVHGEMKLIKMIQKDTNQPKSDPNVPALACTHCTSFMHMHSFPAVSVRCQAQSGRGGKSGGVT